MLDRQHTTRKKLRGFVKICSQANRKPGSALENFYMPVMENSLPRITIYLPTTFQSDVLDVFRDIHSSL